MRLLFFLFLVFAPLFLKAGDHIVLNEHDIIEKEISYKPADLFQTALPRTKDEELNELLDKGNFHFANLSIENSVDRPLDYIFKPAGRNKIWVFYSEIGDSDYQLKKTGRLIPYPENELLKKDNSINKVRIPTRANTSYNIVVIVPNTSDVDKLRRISFQEYNAWETGFYSSRYYTSINSGVFFGILLALALINFIFYLVYKDRNYPVYSAYILFMILYEAGIYGFFVEYTFISSYPKLGVILDNIFLNGSFVFYLWFLQTFVDMSRYPVWKKILPFITGTFILNIFIASFIVIVFEDLYLSYIVRNYIILAVIPLALIFLYKLFKSNSQTENIFFYGTLSLVVFGLISMAFFLYDTNLNSDFYFQIGIIIEAIIFSIGLGIRVKLTYRESIQAQGKLIDQLEENDKLQRSMNDQLEDKVTHRTNELKQRNQDLEHKQEELMAQRDILEEQKVIIQQKNHELENARENLEQIVKERTNQLILSNQELINQNQQLEQYAFITAHNLKAPVARLKGLTYLFNHEKNGDEASNEIVDRLNAAADDLDITLNDLNTVLNIKSRVKHKELFSLQDCIDRVKASLEDPIENNNAVIKTALTIDQIHSNKVYFESIFYNLISNAIKYKKKDRSPEITIMNSMVDDVLRFYIMDNGIGIDLKRYKEKLFGLYQRFHNHVEGKGMGLFIVKTQVESLSGSIEIKSELEKGTTFILEFPVSSIIPDGEHEIPESASS